MAYKHLFGEGQTEFLIDLKFLQQVPYHGGGHNFSNFWSTKDSYLEYSIDLNNLRDKAAGDFWIRWGGGAEFDKIK